MVVITFKTGQAGKEEVVRTQDVEIPNEKETPVMVIINFKTDDGLIVDKKNVVIHQINKTNGKISFTLYSVLGSQKFTVSVKNIQKLMITMSRKEFLKRFRISRGRKPRIRNAKPQEAKQHECCMP